MQSKIEIKILLNGLQIGMFVSQTDRPWEELPFIFKGFLVRSKEEIDIFKKHCKYVYINPDLGLSANARFWVTEMPESDLQKIVEKDKQIYSNDKEAVILEKVTYKDEVPLQKEFIAAKNIFKQAHQQIAQTYDDLIHIKNLDVAGLKETVSLTVECVIRNPIALRLVMELQRTYEYSYNHALATSVWCAQMGRQLGMEKHDIEDLALGGLLLDIGKTKLPEHLLTKNDLLNEDEQKLIKSHVCFSSKILAPHNFSKKMIQMVDTHHERADGSGYPKGLKYTDIPLFGRIAGIVDSFDAMTSPRPYDIETIPPQEAIHKLYQLRGTLFQSALVEQFIQTVGMYPTGTLVQLNTGQVGVVTEINKLKRLRPVIALILDENKQHYEDFNSINLAKEDDISISQTLVRNAYGINMNELFI